jgi:hypothetical protein
VLDPCDRRLGPRDAQARRLDLVGERRELGLGFLPRARRPREIGTGGDVLAPGRVQPRLGIGRRRGNARNAGPQDQGEDDRGGAAASGRRSLLRWSPTRGRPEG